MAHETARVGSVSESLAEAILTKHGWDVSIPVAVEPYDLIAKDPSDNRFKRIQVKTMKVRRDMENRLVVKGAKSNGLPYLIDEVDLIACVYGSHLYLIENTEQTEYTAADVKAAQDKWTTLRLDTSRSDIISEAIFNEPTF